MRKTNIKDRNVTKLFKLIKCRNKNCILASKPQKRQGV